MKPVRYTVSGVANGAAVPCDIYQSPFQLSIGVVVTGTVSYTLQYTYDDPAGTITNWINHSLMTTLTATADTVINGGPVTAVRVINNAAGSVACTFVQAGAQ